MTNHSLESQAVATDGRFRVWDASALGIVILFGIFPLLSRDTLIVVDAAIVVLSVVSWRMGSAVAVPLGVFCTVCITLALLRLPSQLWLALGLAAYAVVGLRVGRFRGELSWLRVGTFSREVVALTLATVLLAAVALVMWFQTVRPDISDIIEMFVPKWDLPWLILGGLLFSMVNAAVEEGAYRGVIMQALDRSIGINAISILGQAAAFGILHIHGFPRGWVGVALASVFGLAMGLIRRRSNGMLTPWIAHVCADIVIVAIVVLLTRG